MINVLVVGSHPSYNLEQYVINGLTSLGINARFFGYRQFFQNRFFNITRMAMTRSFAFRKLIASPLFLSRFNDELLRVTKTGNWDLIFVLKGEAVLPSTLERIDGSGTKLALWFPDDPRYFESLVKHIVPYYHFVFTTSTESNMLERYRRLSYDVSSLPVACDETIHHKILHAEKKFDISFVGTYTPYRGRIIKALRKKDVNVAVFGPYWDKFIHEGPVFHGAYGPQLVEIFNQSRLCLNIQDPDSAKLMVNMRVFEVTGSGGVLLTDYGYGISDFFKPGEQILMYDDIESLIEQIKYYNHAESELREISIRAEEKAHKMHTYKHRMEVLLSKTGIGK